MPTRPAILALVNGNGDHELELKAVAPGAEQVVSVPSALGPGRVL